MLPSCFFLFAVEQGDDRTSCHFMVALLVSPGSRTWSLPFPRASPARLLGSHFTPAADGHTEAPDGDSPAKPGAWPAGQVPTHSQADSSGRCLTKANVSYLVCKEPMRRQAVFFF